MSRQRKDKNTQVIYYARNFFVVAQRKYATIENELLTVVFAFDKFRSYLIGLEVIMYSNHLALKYLMRKKDAKLRLIQCILQN